jgi:hypothetical protein
MQFLTVCPNGGGIHTSTADVCLFLFFTQHSSY